MGPGSGPRELPEPSPAQVAPAKSEWTQVTAHLTPKHQATRLYLPHRPRSSRSLLVTTTKASITGPASLRAQVCDRPQKPQLLNNCTHNYCYCSLSCSSLQALRSLLTTGGWVSPVLQMEEERRLREEVTPGSSRSEREPSLIPSTVLPHVTGENRQCLPLGRDKGHKGSSGDRGPELESLLNHFPVV